MMGGFFLGMGGTTFAVGVPFVSAWFPPARRGLAIGIFGAGMGGTAISALTTVKLFATGRAAARSWSPRSYLACYARWPGCCCGTPPAAGVPAGHLGGGSPPTRGWGHLAGLRAYAVAFGGYVAFSVYLPAYLRNGYGLAPPTPPTGWPGSSWWR